MDKNIKTIGLTLAVVFGVYLALSIRPMFAYYWPKNYVTVGGSRFTESDLEKEKPQLLQKAKKQYIEAISEALESFGSDKMLEMEAKEKGIKKEDVLTGAMDYAPSDSEVMAVYEQYKDKLGGRKVEEVRPQIINFLTQNRQGEYLSHLKEKYKVSVYVEEIKPTRVEVSEGDNPALGLKNAKVTVIEFSDFECPFCKRSQDVNRNLRNKYGDKIRWVFRDFPLPFHQNAMYAHIAANCANKQEKYWDFFNILFDNSGNLSKENVDALAGTARLDKKQYEACVSKSEDIKSEINSDIAYGQKLGVNGTPAFFINGIFLEGALPQAKFEQIIDEELKK